MAKKSGTVNQIEQIVLEGVNPPTANESQPAKRKNQPLYCVRDTNKFNPQDYLIDITDKKTGDMAKYLEVQNRILWFWSVYPDGRLIQKVTLTDTYVAVESEVYFNKNDEKPTSNGNAMRWFGDRQEKTLEWAETTALGRALNNCGFGTQYSGTDLEEPDPANAGIPITPKATPESNAKGNSGTTPKSMPIEAAAKIKCPIGKERGKTLGDLYKEHNRQELVYLSKEYTPKNEKDKIVNIAAAVMLEYYDKAIEAKKAAVKKEVDDQNKASANTVDAAPAEETPEDEAPADAAPAEEAPEDEAPATEAPEYEEDEESAPAPTLPWDD